MEDFEDSIRTRVVFRKSAVPPASDLEFYAKPENYTGANSALQHFIITAQKHLTSFQSPSQVTRPSGISSAPPHAARTHDKSFHQESTSSVPDTNQQYVCDDNTEYIQSRRSSVQIQSKRGPIHLEIRSRRKISSACEPRPNFERSKSLIPEEEEENFSQLSGKVQGIFENYISAALDRSQKASSSGLYSKEERIAWARERFRHAIKLVIILLKWITSLTEKEEDQHHRTFTEIASDAFSSDELKNSGLTFDLSLFKANREINISNETKSILSIPATSRNPEQLQTALYGLQHLKSFAEYPLHMQEKLCKVAWFQHVPPKRVIIRQGHYAENFYFILSGHALVRILEHNEQTGEVNLRTAAIMRKGTSFGELALLHHSRRTATVVSQDTVQLLTIGRDDFFDIFMGGNNPGEIPDHIKFCSTLDFMKDWPIQNLLDHPECCLFHFFKRGVVIVKDSNQSEWLYIVKSGSCQVMKQLKGVVPKLGRPRSAMSGLIRDTSLLPNLYSTGTKVDTGLRRRYSTGQQGRTPSPVQHARHCYELYSDKTASVPKKTTLSFITSVRPDSGRLHKPCTDSAPRHALSISTKLAPDSKTQVPNSNMKAPDSKTQVPNSNMKAPNSNPKALNSNTQASNSKTQAPNSKTLEKRSNKGPVFVKVEVLKPRDVFGLSTIKFDDDFTENRTSVSLVSSGAECVMLSKKFFMQHANELVKKRLREQICHYPTEETLQENLQTKVNWDLYKEKLIRKTLTSKSSPVIML